MTIPRTVMVAALLAMSSQAALAQSPRVELEAKVVPGASPDVIATEVRGEMTVSDWSQATPRCLYLPFNDPDYGLYRESAQQLGWIKRRQGRVYFHGGATKLEAKQGDIKLKELAPFLLEVTGDAPSFTLGFASTLPRRPNPSHDDAVFDGFHPLLLESCPEPGLATHYYAEKVVSFAKVDLETTPGMDLVSPVQNNHCQDCGFISAQLPFVMLSGHRRKDLNIDGLPVSIFYTSDEFLKLVPTIEHALVSHRRWLGRFPFPQLVVIESAELESSDLPGIVTINRPRQALFKFLQSGVINWQHWVATSLIASQWYGAALRSASPDDLWFMRGTVDFLTLMALRGEETRYNLFRSDAESSRLLSLTYLEAQDLTAALANQTAPSETLTNDRFESTHDADEQNPLIFVRHAVALRNLTSLAGQEAFASFLRQFTQRRLHRIVEPKEFLTALGEPPSPFSASERSRLKEVLTTWWTHEGWPDYALRDLETKELSGNGWLAKITIERIGELDVPVEVAVTDERGLRYFGLALPDPSNARRTVEIVTAARPVSAEVDPQRQIFDTDRFNNQDRWPPIKFFPGSAKTLADDAYTVLWLPYPMRRPGEGFALGLQFAVFRYLNSGFTARVERELHRARTGYYAIQQVGLPNSALSFHLMSQQNFEGHRVTELAATRNQIFSVGPKVGLGVRLRERRIYKEPETAHFTSAVIATMSPRAVGRACRYLLGLEYESTPSGQDIDFSYERRTASLMGGCRYGDYVDLSVRLFRGHLNSHNSVFANVFFDPENLQEARLRLDEEDVALSSDIGALNTDLLFPFILPLPNDSLVLGRQLKWRLFYDYGRAYDRNLVYRAAGTGLVMPFGGDLSGGGSFALTQMTLLVVFYSAMGDEVDRKPRVLFDLTGEL